MTEPHEFPDLRSGLVAGGAPLMWERAIRSLMPTMKERVPQGSSVLEIGYGDGLLSCHLRRSLGWSILGLDISEVAYRQALANRDRFGIGDGLDFKLTSPSEVWNTRGRFDAVFVKTVLYSSQSMEEYGHWLDWVDSVLNPRGVFIDFETGRANALTQVYRRIRRREYTDSCLYTAAVERLYDERFAPVHREYFGGISQFAAPIPLLYRLIAHVEERLLRRTADNCFIAAMIYQKKP